MAKQLKKDEHSVGCNLEKPDKRDFMYENIALGAGELPEEFIIDVPHMYQNGIDACVGFGVAEQKTVQEGKKISPRVIWGKAKKFQQYKGWGTYISYALKAVTHDGSTDYGMVDESVSMDRDKYMRIADNMTKEQNENALKNRAQSYWVVKANDWELAMRTVFTEGLPLITSSLWYRSFAKTNKGFLPKPSGKALGHCYIFKGWKTEKKTRRIILVFQNSHRKSWGSKGDFFIYLDEVEQYKIGTFFILKDIPKDMAKLINKYNGKLIKTKNNSRVYSVEKDTVRWITNELAFWLFTKTNRGWGDIEIISQSELNSFRKGKNITPNDFDEHLLEVLKNMYEMYSANPEYATKLFKSIK